MKGLALVEIVILTIIAVILIALVLPYFLMPREQKLALEARTRSVEIRLAQINVRSRDALNNWLEAGSYERGAKHNDGWDTLGLKPLPNNAPFTYSCTPSLGICTALRLKTTSDAKAGGTITIDLDSGNVSCGVPYHALSGSNTETRCG